MNRSGVLAYAVGPIGGGILSTISLPILTWLFSVEDIGRLTMLQVALNFSTLIFCLGLDQAYVREYHETENKAALFLMCAAPGFFLLVITASAFIIIDPNFIPSILFENNFALAGYFLLINCIAAYINRYLSLILRMKNRGLAYSLSQVSSRALLLIIALSYFLISPPYNFMMLLFAQTAAAILTFVILGWNTCSDWRYAFSARFEFDKLRAPLRYGAPLVVAGFLSWALNSLDRLFLRSYSNYEELGIYSVASSFAAATALLAAIFNTIWAPLVFKWISEKADLKRINNISDQLMAIMSIFILLAGGFTWILKYILPDKYHTVPWMVVGCMLPQFLYTLSEVTGIGIAVTKKTGYSIFVSLIALLFGALVGFYLVPAYGANGAMYSMLAAFWVFFALRTEISARIWISRKRANLYINSLLLVFYVVCCSLAGEYNIEILVVFISILLAIGLGVFKWGLIRPVLLKVLN